jgi:voltage-gated potassium channel
MCTYAVGRHFRKNITEHFVHFRSELFVSALSALSVAVILLDFLYTVDETVKIAIYIFDAVVVMILATDFYKRYRKSNEGWKFFVKHWYELPAMLPVFVLAFVETQLLIGAAVRLLRLFRIIHLFFRATSILEGSRFAEIIIYAGGVIIIGGIAGYMVEAAAPDTKMPTLGDALWWSVVTVATVGYGDVVPVTAEGKVVGVFLMITGVATFAMVTSRLATAFLHSKSKEGDSGESKTPSSLDDQTRALLKQKIDHVGSLSEREVDTLTAMIKALWKAENQKP